MEKQNQRKSPAAVSISIPALSIGSSLHAQGIAKTSLPGGVRHARGAKVSFILGNIILFFTNFHPRFQMIAKTSSIVNKFRFSIRFFPVLEKLTFAPLLNKGYISLS